MNTKYLVRSVAPACGKDIREIYYSCDQGTIWYEDWMEACLFDKKDDAENIAIKVCDRRGDGREEWIEVVRVSFDVVAAM